MWSWSMLQKILRYVIVFMLDEGKVRRFNLMAFTWKEILIFDSIFLIEGWISWISYRPRKSIAKKSLQIIFRTDVYRITVKKEKDGLVSSYLHDTFSVGDVLDAGVPCGHFTLQSGSSVFLAAGVESFISESTNKDLRHLTNHRPWYWQISFL